MSIFKTIECFLSLEEANVFISRTKTAKKTKAEVETKAKAEKEKQEEKNQIKCKEILNVSRKNKKCL